MAVSAGKFATTVKRLLSANPGLSLAPSAQIPVGTVICVFPCTLDVPALPGAA